MTDFQKIPNDPNQGKADQAKEEAGQLGQTAKQQAAEVKDTAVGATQQVADTAKQEAVQVVGEARDQIRGLIDTTLGEVRGRTAEGQSAIASTVKSLADELGQMTRESSASGPVAQLVGDLSRRGDDLSTWLGASEPGDIVTEVRRFAARRPGAFLAVAAGAGLLAGRLARGTREVVVDDREREQYRTQLTETRYAQTSYTQQPDYARTTGYGPGYVQPVAGDQTGYGQVPNYDETGYARTQGVQSGFAPEAGYATEGDRLTRGTEFGTDYKGEAQR